MNIPWWQWTKECPKHLVNIAERDKVALAVHEEDFVPITWQQAKFGIATGNTDFARRPKVLRAYRDSFVTINQIYATNLDYLKGELGWEDLRPSAATPFGSLDDYQITLNGYPYGWDDGIYHVVVWCKFPLPDGEGTLHVNKDSRDRIDRWVRVQWPTQASEDIMWWRNPVKFKSVPELEHFHVLLRCPDPYIIDELESRVL
ncbi:hypothetical protein BT63DRAFT_377461 [Microthyrium microscopicum]|uniref:Uncharacterized protein n=1 Tax=Microthyrium microscopicum TaxID=703497 RepID=A0A6A6U1R6_9PEZI|nr:hypothetical protein BT63DRAFT_377461 [Microthyrium microscopicum]